MSGKSSVLLIAAALNLALGLLVYSKGPGRPANRTFTVFVIALSGWSLTNFFVKLGIGVAPGFLVAKFAFALASLAVCAFLAFALVFPEAKVDSTTISRLRTVFAIGTIVSVLSFTPLIIKGVTPRPWGLAPIYGTGYPLLALYGIVFLALGIAILAKKLVRLPSSYARLQLKYLFWGLGIFATSTLLFTVGSTLVTGNNRLVYLGPLSSIFMVALIAYAIVRYRLMEIEIAFQRGLVYLTLVVVLCALFLSLDWALGLLLAPHSLAASLLAFLPAALLLPVLQKKVERAISYLVPWESPDYARILREFGQQLTEILAVRGLQALIVKAMVEVMQANRAALWLLESGEGSHFRPVAAYPGELPTAPPEGFEIAHPLCRKLKATRQVLVREELARQLESEEFAELQEGFDTLAAALVVPLFSRGELYGLLALEEKRSRKIFSDQDIQFLSAIGHQAAIGLKNAALYNEIRVARDHYGMLLKHMDSGVIATDSQGTLITLNPKAEDVLRMRREDVLGRKASVLGKTLAAPLEDALNGWSTSQREVLLAIPAGDLDQSSKHKADRAKGKAQSSKVAAESTQLKGQSGLEMRVQHCLSPQQNKFERREEIRTGGQKVFLRLSATPLWDWEQRQVGSLLVFSDLTDKWRLEEEVQRTQRLASLGALAGRVAHEVRNPLVAVKTFCEVLPERHLDAEFVTSFSSLVLKEVNRINGIVSQLLDISRFSPNVLEPIDVTRVLQETLTLVQNELTATEVTIVRDFCDENMTFLGDEGKFKQVLLNVFMNSLQGMDGRGTIRIVTGNTGPSRRNGTGGSGATSSGFSKTLDLWIQVVDTGRGISPEHLPYVFDPFFTTKEKGSGLGLFICQGIIKEFKGEIEIDSEAGEGTTVTLRLPSNPYS